MLKTGKEKTPRKTEPTKTEQKQTLKTSENRENQAGTFQKLPKIGFKEI
jgi:hypothetical protein